MLQLSRLENLSLHLADDAIRLDPLLCERVYRQVGILRVRDHSDIVLQRALKCHAQSPFFSRGKSKSADYVYRRREGLPFDPFLVQCDV